MGSSSVLDGARFVMVAATLLSGISYQQFAVAELSVEDKQLLLDVHNYYRASVNAADMNQIVWSTDLASRAQKIIEDSESVCDVSSALSPRSEGDANFTTNVAYNTSEIGNDVLLGDVVNYWLQSTMPDFGVAIARQPVLWFGTKMMGCAEFLCPRLYGPEGERYPNAHFLVCMYGPRYYTSTNRDLLYTQSPTGCDGRDARCTASGRKTCVKFRSGGDESRLEEVISSVSDVFRTGSYCAGSSQPALVPEEEQTPAPPAKRVYGLSPGAGSLAGGQRITLTGTGLRVNNFDGGVRVTLENVDDRNDVIECDVVNFFTGRDHIVCDTRPASNPESDARYSINVQINDGSGRGFEEVEVCSQCTFLYNFGYWTPKVRNIEPSAATFGEVITFVGDFFASSFNDTDGDTDDGQDVYTRILIGGRGCQHETENGTEYGLTLDEDNKRSATAKCLPENTFAIESSNVTLVLARRGNSHVPLSSNLMSLDNKLQPYTFQTHADIVRVSPTSGSVEGGTTISITVNAPLTLYSNEDIRVKVGGVPCSNVYIVEAGARESVISCVTGPQPQQRSFYPGSRGVKREVFFPDSININLVAREPPSVYTSVVDKLFRSTEYDTPEFGEDTDFTQRYSGFFVPPMSSLYTFNIHSDDLSQLFFSPNASTNKLLEDPIISISQWTRERWDYFPEQFSPKFYLEAGQYYYFEMISNQGLGPWDIGLAAKVHSLNHTSYPYQGDRERQRINITSSVVMEKVGISIRARPAVKELVFYPRFVPNDNTNVSCPTLLTFTFAGANNEQTMINISVSALDKPEDVERKLNTSLLDAGINTLIHVAVEFFGDRGSREVGVRFYFIILTPTMTPSGVPEIAVWGDQSNITCINLNSEADPIDEGLLSVRVELETVQNQSFPNSFKIGYENLTVMPGMRFTNSFPLDASAMALEEAIFDLYGWGCRNQPTGALLQQVSVYQTYEYGDNRDIQTSFCGHGSLRNPRRFWQVNLNNALDIGNSPFLVCFAYRGAVPQLWVRASFDEVDPNDNTIQSSGFRTVSIRDCLKSVSTLADDWKEHQCFDLKSCLVDKYDNRVLHNLKFRWLQFGYQENFYVDEFFLIDTSRAGFGNFEVSRVSDEPRLSFNDVIIESVEVTGGSLDFPVLLPFSISGTGSGSSSDSPCSNPGGSGLYPEEYENSCNETQTQEGDSEEPQFIMVVSEFQVSYSVLDCGYELPRPTGYYDIDGYAPMGVRVDIEQLQEASLPVSGDFSITIGETSLQFPHNVTAEQLANLLSAQLPEEGGFDVTRMGSCRGYSWDISWKTKGGDQPLVGVSGERLLGSEVMIAAMPMLDGGTWIRPIRGDMLRVPMEQPQVEVIINDIPSSCRGNVCSFNFTDGVTPVVDSVYPAVGQGGTVITLYGRGFSSVPADIDIVIGNASCRVTSSSEMSIECVASNHTAGWYRVRVKIEGKGMAIVNESICFNYLLSVDSITPESGGVGGGEIVTITGNGFMEFVKYNNTEFGIEVSSLPWFHSGIGLPNFRRMRDIGLCPSIERELLYYRKELLDEFTPQAVVYAAQNIDSFEHFNRSNRMPGDFDLVRDGRFNVENFRAHLFNIYLRFPAYVLLGEVPCVIAESTFTEISCIPVLNLPQVANLTVVVLTESVHMENVFEIAVNSTVFVENVEPSEGAVVGRTLLSISGYNFKAYSTEDVTVFIGMAKCEVYSANDTHILCYTPPTGPSLQPVYVLTPAGVAVWKTSLEEQLGGDRTEEGSGGSDMGLMMGDRDLPPFPVFAYKLEVVVDQTTLFRGSSFGGTLITLSGGIFVRGYTEITVGGLVAEIVSMSENEVSFFTPTSTRKHYIGLRHSQLRVDNTVELYWNQSETTIQVGDTVEWDWDLQIPGYTSFEFEIYQTMDNESLNRLPAGGFSSAQSSTSHSVTFDEPGVYYYLGNTITPRFGEPVHGVVMVTEPRTSTKQIKVIVGGFEAKFVTEEGVSSGAGMVRRRRETGRLEPTMNLCEEEVQMSMQSGDAPTFVYSGCNTPTVLYVTPQVGYGLSTVYTISGSLFSETRDQNIVKFDDYTCKVQNSSSDEINCVFSPGLEPPAFTSLELSLQILDPSKGTAYTRDISATTIEIKPVIHDFTPTEGSLEGGTDIRITGEGFKCPDEQMIQVTIGSFPCSVTSYSYTEIQCTTVAVDSPRELNLSVWCGSTDRSAMCVSGCSYSYSTERTPMVTAVTPSSYSGEALISMEGSGFAEQPQDNIVTVGANYSCTPIISTSSLIVCRAPALPANSYELTLKVCNVSNDRCFGYASFYSNASRIMGIASLTSVSPVSGSLAGGTTLTIQGTGFVSDISAITVDIGGRQCEVRSASYNTLTCITDPNNAGTYTVSVLIEGLSPFPQDSISYEYSMASTPIVNSISPTSGRRGDNVTISGSGFGNDASAISVNFDGSECNIVESMSGDDTVVCELGSHPVATVSPEVIVEGAGIAMPEGEALFDFTLFAGSPSEGTGSFAGMNTITIPVDGADPSETTIRICDQECVLSPDIVPTDQELACIVPSAEEFVNMQLMSCDIVVESVGETFGIEDGYTYNMDLTPVVHSINRTRGGTEGGSPIMISGEGFTGNANVTIAGSVCDVIEQTVTTIICITNRSGRTVRAPVMVDIEEKGFAISNITFWYVDLWSSRFTWGGGPLPQEGDFVVIPRGQTLLLDVKTPILSYLLIQGGELIFDPEKGDNEVSLHTQGGLITSGGLLQIGTEEEPYLAKTELVLYGHPLSTEIPVYGAKTFALREGVMDMHGRPINITWTKLATTAEAGDSQIELQEYVDWDVDGKIVLASTSFSQRENEEHTIVGITAGLSGSILTLQDPLKYQHISVQQTIAGRYIDTSGEVGYLTRNIVVRGNTNEEWIEEVDACEREFRPGQFDIQSCFRGRFGPETLSDQFGSQIMIHGPRFTTPEKTYVIGRFEYIEVRHAGQAFRLGRYPIHFHLNGDVSESYVRGCAIHNTFNRAVTMHGIDNLLVEKNVAYNVMGHAYFLEDGAERFNVIQDNLGIFVRGSSSLLNVDITAATFWVVNPTNTVRRNAAAGGTHFGFWYRMTQHPTGPSTDRSICPQKQRVLEFADNSAHSFGWYGLWIFQFYYPTVTGACGDNTPAPSYYDRLLSWRNDRGVEFSEIGSIQLRDSIMLDNNLAGVEYTDLSNTEWGDDGPLIQDTLIVGHSEISRVQRDNASCTTAGIRTPHSYFLTISGVTFVNFDRNNCFPILACSHCRTDLQGGFESRFRNITFDNVPSNHLTQWKWTHEHIQRDMDGTLTRTGEPKLLIPTNNLLDPAKCQVHAGSTTGAAGGSICDGDVRFSRVGIFDPSPSSLRFADITLSNDHGTDRLVFVDKRLRGGAGYMAQLAYGDSYQITFLEGQTFTNISYSLVLSGFEEDDYLVISQQYPRELDETTINGIDSPVNASAFDDPRSLRSGNWFTGDNNTLNYILKRDSGNDEPTVRFSTLRCFYENCIPPPPPPLPTLPPPAPRCDNVQRWSETTTWPAGQLPRAGENVFINSSKCVLVDVEIPRLGTIFIEGDLELEDSRNHVIEAELIIINGGALIAGTQENPFVNKVRFVLHGNTSSPEFRFQEFASPTVGAKAIGVFGQLILHSRVPEVTWTFLSQTAAAESSIITVEGPIDGWGEGDSIVITSTSYDAFETEVVEIGSVDGNRINLAEPLKFKHSGGGQTIGSSGQFYHRAEVGLLTRRIKIENGEPGYADEEAFGCRVLVSNNGKHLGTAQLQGVEFSGCGQLGYTEDFDPRFALAYFNTGRQIGTYASYVKNCSFHDGYNTAIGVFLTSNMVILDNIIHGTVGDSVIITGSDHVINHNLASLAQFIGTYRDRNEVSNDLWTANFELTEARDFEFMDNVAAGGAKAGYHTHGEHCTESSSIVMRNNIAHSSLHCIHLGYRDGHADCSRFSSFTLFNCYHYGLFSYSRAGIHITNSTFINNKAAVYVSVIGPAARSHQVGMKAVDIDNTLIVSASNDFDCDEDGKVPEIATHPISHNGLRSPTGGHVGIVVPSFVSGSGHFPRAAWFSIISYPAINGITRISDVTFVNFQKRCDTGSRSQNDVVIMVSPGSEDANHPVYFKSISFTSGAGYNQPVDPELRVFSRQPNLGRVNPSDCVDMDCDGHKQIVMKDLDGSFTQMPGAQRTIISVAEFEWDGDPRRGLGDYRIPRTMLTYPDNGSRIPVDSLYPQKGIVRGVNFGDVSDCSYMTTWNMHLCSNLDHLMLILESLDADTEVRRLSPIGIGANGFINLVNGPMDNGWCGGYTCQERISTFYTIVAAGFDYTVGLTSTNPQEFAVRLLHADNTQAIIVGIIYTNPQALDVYRIDDRTGARSLILPTNARNESGNIRYVDRDPNLPRNQFIPGLTSMAGANFYDRDTKQLYIHIRGNYTYRIMTRPVIMLSLTLQVSLEEFFDEDTIVRNIALLLGIPDNKIRIVNVVRETQNRRKRQAEQTQTIDFEIGNQPGEDTTTTPTTSANVTDDVNGTMTTAAPVGIVLSLSDLQTVAERAAEAVQTGMITQSLNATVVSAAIEEPEPPRVDPTGGMLATPDTGGPQPLADENGTFLNFFELQNRTDTPMTYDQLVQEREDNETTATAPIRITVPTTLITLQEVIGTVVEGIPIPSHLGPQVAMNDNNNERVLNLGLEIPWQATATVLSGPPDGFLTNEMTNFDQGVARFDGLTFSHPGDYQLSIRVTYPESVDFSVAMTVTVMPRRLVFLVSQQPLDGNATFPLYPHPAVQLWDGDTNELIREHNWRNLTWYVTGYVFGTPYRWQVPLTNGEAIFTDVLIKTAGTYRLRFVAYTTPTAPLDHLPAVVTSEPFTIAELPLTRIRVTYDVDFGSTIGGNETGFRDMFVQVFEREFPAVEISNINITEGSIIVTIDVVAKTPQILVSFVSQVTSNIGATTLSFVFNNTFLVPSNVTQDPDFVIVLPTDGISEDQLVLILATTIPAGTILITGLLVIIVAYLCMRQKKYTKSVTIKVKPANTPGAEERYVMHNHKGAFEDNISSQSSINEYYLLPEHRKDEVDTRSFEYHELSDLNSATSTPASQKKTDFVTSTEVSVPGAFFANPLAHREDCDNNIERLSNLEGSIDEIWNKASVSETNSNNNNGIEVEAALSLPNVVPPSEPTSTSRPGTGTNRPRTGSNSHPGTGTRPVSSSSRPGTGTRPPSSRPEKAALMSSSSSKMMDDMIVEDVEREVV